jgi:hypothetical protein
MFLGDQIDTRQCTGCRGNVQIKVFDCGHPLHDETTIPECGTCPHFEDRLQVGAVRNWAVGVTTAPRTNSTLMRCLASLRTAGWEEVRLFAEAGSQIPSNVSDIPVTWRESIVGAWPNFYLALAELYLREPRADAYFMVQDDTVFCRNLRGFLEASLWPAEKLGLLSVFCSAACTQAGTGFLSVDGTQGLFGAQAYIFPNASLRLLLSHPETIAHRLRGETDGMAMIDVVVGEWATKLKLPVLCHNPSLADHIGDTSTIWPGAQLTGRRAARDFVGEDFDAMSKNFLAIPVFQA